MKARRTQAKAKSRRDVPSEILTVEISRLGPAGDGICQEGPLYVAGALPGETVRVSTGLQRGEGRQASIIEVLTTSPNRVSPPCVHASQCGGCTVQHLAADAYAEWKRELVLGPLRQARLLDGVVEPLRTTPFASRRRATFAARRVGSRVTLGFHAPRSDQIVEISGCLVLHPKLAAVLAPLRELLVNILHDHQRADIFVALTDSGLDIALSELPAPGLAVREAVGAWAELHDIARLSWLDKRGAEPLAQRRSPRLSFGGVPVRLPAGAFTQASAEAETVLVAAVLEAVAPTVAQNTPRRIADLFCGLGTFSLPLVQTGAKVLAVEGDALAVAHLVGAANAAGLGQRLTATKRDLFTLPLLAKELGGFDAVVFDPPRAGAKAQAEALAASQVPVVVAVSCNPATFARDSAALVAGGYRLDWVRPIDQFHWTGHVELVARFSR